MKPPSPTAAQAVISQLADGFITVTATYDDGLTAERTYALAVHETNDAGEVVSYRLEDATPH